MRHQMEDEACNSEFKTRLRKARRECYMSESQLAEALGVDEEYIKAVEAGEKEASPLFINALCYFLGVRMPYAFKEEWIKTGNGEMTHQSAHDKNKAKAEKTLKEGEKLDKVLSIKTDEFGKVTAFLWSFLKELYDYQMNGKQKSFRMEMFYDEEALQTEFYFVPIMGSVQSCSHQGNPEG